MSDMIAEAAGEVFGEICALFENDPERLSVLNGWRNARRTGKIPFSEKDDEVLIAAMEKYRRGGNIEDLYKSVENIVKRMKR